MYVVVIVYDEPQLVGFYICGALKTFRAPDILSRSPAVLVIVNPRNRRLCSLLRGGELVKGVDKAVK